MSLSFKVTFLIKEPNFIVSHSISGSSFWPLCCLHDGSKLMGFFSLFQADFKLMCDNAMTYNRPDTVYYKLAKKILHAGFKMMSKVRDPLRVSSHRNEFSSAWFMPNRNSLPVNDLLPSIRHWPCWGPLCSRVDAQAASPRPSPPPATLFLLPLLT